MFHNKPQAASGLPSERHNVYCGYSHRDNYIAGWAHNVYRGYSSAKHNILCFVLGHGTRRPEDLAPCYADTLESFPERVAGTVAIAGIFLLLAFI